MRYRTIRRGENSRASGDVITNAEVMLAATSCGSPVERARAIQLRRGATSKIRPVAASAATSSPTTGRRSCGPLYDASGSSAADDMSEYDEPRSIATRQGKSKECTIVLYLSSVVQGKMKE